MLALPSATSPGRVASRDFLAKGAADTQPPRAYSRPRDLVHSLSGPPVPPRLPAEAADVGRAVLLHPRSLGPSDSVARVVCPMLDRLVGGHRDLCDHAVHPADHVRAHPAERRRRRRVSDASADGRWSGRDRRGTRKDAGVQSRQAIGTLRWRHLRLLAAIRCPQSLLLLRPGPGLRRDHVPFDSLDNGFLGCADPTRLQAISGQLGPADVQAIFDR
jgi:hypothetical protein